MKDKSPLKRSVPESPIVGGGDAARGRVEVLNGPLAEVDFKSLSKSQRLLARFIDANPAFCGRATAAELAAKVGVSEATVVRFAMATGATSYKAFRNSIHNYHLQTLTPLEEFRKDQESKASVLNAFRNQVLRDVQNLQASLELIDESRLDALVEEIMRARTIVVLSSGSYASVGTVLVHILRFLGFMAVLEDGDVPNVSAALLPLSEEDLVIAISFWRVIRTTADGVSWARSRGIPTFAITDSRYSPLAHLADQSLEVAVETSSFFHSMVSPLALVYGIGAYLGHTIDESRRQVMQAGIESMSFFKSNFATPRDPNQTGAEEHE